MILDSSQSFSIEVLNQFDGKNGKPACIVYKGKVYDVTDSYQWIDGEHLGEHKAGKKIAFITVIVKSVSNITGRRTNGHFAQGERQ